MYADKYNRTLANAKLKYRWRFAVKIGNIADDIIVFSVRGEPDLGDELQAIAEMVADGTDNNVIVNFVGVDIIRSSSLTKLLELRQALIARGRQLVLCSVHPLTKSILEITDINKVLAIAADKEAGVSLIRSSQFAHVS
jgi:anti-anti-sigma factor